MRLAIGRKGECEAKANQILDLNNCRVAHLEDVVKAAENKRFVFIGESHTNAAHHQFQADVISALVKSGRPVVVGFEMFTRPVQDTLNTWTLGWETEAEFIQKSDWKHQWGMDFALYRPIFNVVHDDKLPMVALNIPRPWVHTVGQGGFDALTAEQRSALPTPIGTLNPRHKQIFEAMMGGHPMGGPSHMYDAQVLWDEAMADSALKYLDGHPMPSNTAFVVIAGAGHVMYGQGINWRIKQRTGEDGLTIVMVDGEPSTKVARGIADFVYSGGTTKAE
jgi:uncharacterized iron-regulated protein